MKKLFLILFSCLPCVLSAQSTSYTFEEATTPAQWVANNGSLSLSMQQFKEGGKSLCWETTGAESVLEVSTSTINTTGRRMAIWVRSQEPTNDILKIEFIHTDGKVKRTGQALINYRGWSELNRGYGEYSSFLTLQVTKVRFTLISKNPTAIRRLWFDNARFDLPAFDDKTNPGKPAHVAWILDKDQLYYSTGMLNVYANEPEIPVQTPTESELAGLQLLRKRLVPQESSNTMLGAARLYANKFNIVRNEDGSVSGKIMDINTGALTRELLDALQTLGAVSIIPEANKTEKDKADTELFYNLLDHAMNQGFHCGMDWYGEDYESWYNNWRRSPTKIFKIASFLEGYRRQEMLELGRWVCNYIIWYPESTYLANLNSDILYLSLPRMYYYAVLQADDAVAVRELKGLARYLGRNADIAPGDAALVKIDGCGFHHGSHYNNYMYSFNTWGTQIYDLRDTPFNIPADKYPRFRFAIESMYLMATRNSLKFANSLAGRNPYDCGGVNMQVPLETIEKLAEVGGQILGLNGPDPEFGALYNFFSMSKKFDVPEKNYNGYYQFNYSPIGVARKDNWVVTMRAPTTRFFGAEIYSGQNRLGRYQSHGTLEVNYSAGPAASGQPVTNGGAGWDWNVVPGTTTVHYTTWTDMNPGETTATGQRLDQVNEKDFSGALAFDKCGVFATDFVQSDKWGEKTVVFNKHTNLKFKKSVFTFDSIFVALGTDISSVNSNFPDLITATNLFQELKSGSTFKLIIDDAPLPEGSEKTIDTSMDSHWILTPAGTGYYVPSGNNNLIVKNGTQKSPPQTGLNMVSPVVEVTAAKAYINHGKQPKPSPSYYSFVVVPGTTREKMEALATQMGNDGGELYTIDWQDSKLHAVTHYPSHTTGYAFFEAVSGLRFGKVVSTTTQHLMMVTDEPGSNQLRIAICNPNLNAKADKTYGFLSQATNTTITLTGKWYIDSKTAGINSAIVVGENTQLSVSMIDGLPEYVTLQLEGTVNGIDEADEEAWVKYGEAGNDVVLTFAQSMDAQVAIYAPDGSLVRQSVAPNSHWRMSKSSLNKGLYLLQVTAPGKKQTFKLVY